MAQSHSVSVAVGAHDMVFETGRMARLCNGSCTVQYADTIILVALAEGPPRPGMDFFPLTMDYREKMYAGGSVPGGFFKREGRPTEKEILTMRMMDRPVRPLWPDGFLWDVQVQCMVISSDHENDADVSAINGASLALMLSDLPFQGPIGAVRIGRIDGEWVLNPTHAQREESQLDLVVVGTAKAITMVEASAKEIPETDMVDALEIGHAEVKKLCAAQTELVAAAGHEKKTIEPRAQDNDLRDGIFTDANRDALSTAHTAEGDKHARNANHKAAVKAIVEAAVPAGDDGEVDKDRAKMAKRYANELSKEVFRGIYLEGGRYDGRAHDEVRALEVEAGLLPRTHGSGLFLRGETQCLSVVTLGTKMDNQLIEGLHDTFKRNFMLHYNFANFCVGEPRFIRGPGRREIGHGKLGERALQAVLPAHDDFPYTIRIVSETLSSNGSSSMASVCGGTLALMDAGVKISQPVAGIAMGLITDGDRKAILTDISGKEDSWGDMDFKVAGTQRGITALQMDIKIDGVSSELLNQALDQARDARIHILKHMLTEIRRPRTDLSPWAPRLERIYIPKDKIGALIGPGGKVIRALQEQYSVTIAVEDDGAVTIYAKDGPSAAECKETIEAITGEAEVGKIYEGKVVSVKEFGAFVELAPGMEGLVHVSELDDSYVANPEDVVNVGDVIKVKCVYVDGAGKVKLSRKAVIREEKGLEVDEYVPPPRRGDRRGGDRGGDRGGRGGDRGGGRGRR